MWIRVNDAVVPKSPLSEVVPAKSSWLTAGGHKLVQGIDTLHIVHNTKSEVLGNIGSAIHPSCDGVHEVLDL